MIDFHSHILPNMDDGSGSVEETFELLKEAEKAGFESVIATSHYMEECYENSAKKQEIWVNALSENLYRENINIKLYLGNEIYLTSNIIELLKTRKASTINGTKYVLFELPMEEKPMNMYDVIYDLLQYKLVPVLAHPERYTFIQKDPEIVYDLIQKGVLMQSNFGSIIGIYGEKAEFMVRKLLENNMIHFLGTDVHKKNTIYPQMSRILSEIKLIVGETKLKELTTLNPQRVLEDKFIDVDEPKEFKLSLTEKIKMFNKKK